MDNKTVHNSVSSEKQSTDQHSLRRNFETIQEHQIGNQSATLCVNGGLERTKQMIALKPIVASVVKTEHMSNLSTQQVPWLSTMRVSSV